MTTSSSEQPRNKPKRAPNKRAKNQPLSDNMFKEVTVNRGQELGLPNVAGELQLRKSTRADLVLQVPDGVSVHNTIFDFFLPLNVIEFKSEDDNPLDDHEFYNNVTRVYAIYKQEKKLELDLILNVIVTAAVPQKFLSFMTEKGYNFEEVPQRKWLRRGRFGNQEIALVICELLPVEPKYYPWLLFAPSNSPTWRKYIEELIMNGDTYRDLLEEAFALRLEPVSKIFKEVMQMENSKRRLTKWEKERLEAFNRVMATERAEGNKFFLKGILSAFPTEERLEGLKPQERLEGLKPQERLEGLKPEQRLEGLKPEQRLEGLKPQEVVASFKPEEQEALLKLLLERQAKKSDTDNSEK